MIEGIQHLLDQAKNKTIPFKSIIEYIDARYQHQPTSFRNGDTKNAPDQNQGSARIFAFAKLNQLDEANTLLLFAEHYKAVLDDPAGDNHQNIRQFIRHGWNGISFDGQPLIRY